MNVRAIRDRASSLVNTSVQDMQSGLWHYTTTEDLAVLRVAYIMARRRNEKTRSKILASKIRRLDKEINHEHSTADESGIHQALYGDARGAKGGSSITAGGAAGKKPGTGLRCKG